jgi:predicted TIM-barrel fold metal-dependent hydrolase
MRIDAHVHCFPDRLALAVRERLGARGGLTAGPLLADVAESVRANGFDGAWILPYAHRAGVAESANEWSAREVPRYPWLVAGATFHPGDDDLARLVDRALRELGLRVVKLHCSVGAFSPADARLEPLWEAASEFAVPIVVHAGQVGGGDSLAEEIEQLVPVLAAHPALKIVLAHSGHPATAATLELMERFDNIYGDLTPVWETRPDIDVDALHRFAGRFLFGSDAPNNPVGAAEQAERWAHIGLEPAALEMILGVTATALLPNP